MADSESMYRLSRHALFWLKVAWAQWVFGCLVCTATFVAAPWAWHRLGIPYALSLALGISLECLLAIWLLSVPVGIEVRADEGRVRFRRTRSYTEVPITDIVAISLMYSGPYRLMASGGEKGAVFFWRDGTRLRTVMTFFQIAEIDRAVACMQAANPTIRVT